MAAVTYNVTPAQFADWAEKLGKNFMPAAKRGVLSGAFRSIHVLVRRTDTAPPASPNGTMGAVNTGLYRAGWKAVVTSEGAQILNLQAYSGVIDGGRRSAPVSKGGIENLRRWAQRKLGLDEAEAKAAAFAIARTLRNRPLRARKVMSGALDEMIQLVLLEVERELNTEFRRIGG